MNGAAEASTTARSQANNTTWSKDASNPDSNGETYNCENWKSRRTDAKYGILQDWRDFTGKYNAQEYMDSINHKVSLATSYTESSKSDELTDRSGSR